MKRRSVLQSILALPAAAAVTSPTTPVGETPNTPVVSPDDTADGLRRTFTVEQFAALRQLGELIVPAWNGYPGASEAGAAEFLDFLVGCSPQPRLDLYRHGLDALNRISHSKFGKPFADVDSQQAATLLAPLKTSMSMDELAPFLKAAKSDLLRATFNSRPYIDAVSQTRRPRNASKYFWYPIS